MSNRQFIHQGSCFLRALHVDLHRAVLSWRFLLAVGLLFVWMFFNGCSNIFIFEFLDDFGIPYTFEQALTGADGLGMLALALATIPYSTSYLTDRESGFDHYAINRVGLSAYSYARVVVVGLSAFLAMVTAAGIFLAGLCLSGGDHSVPGNGEFLNGVYYELAATAGPWCYYLVRFTISGLTATAASVFSLYTTTLIPNAYAALLAPLIGYYAYEAIFMKILHLLFNRPTFAIFVSLDNVIRYQVSRNNGFSFLWAAVFLLTLTMLFGRGYVLRLRKEHDL